MLSRPAGFTSGTIQMKATERYFAWCWFTLYKVVLNKMLIAQYLTVQDSMRLL